MTDVQLRFDRGTAVIDGVPESSALDGIAGVLWDPRVGAYRAPARVLYALAAELRRRGVLTSDARPLPKLAPPVGLRTPELRPYQEAAVTAWRAGGRRGVVVCSRAAARLTRPSPPWPARARRLCVWSQPRPCWPSGPPRSPSTTVGRLAASVMASTGRRRSPSRPSPARIATWRCWATTSDF